LKEHSVIFKSGEKLIVADKSNLSECSDITNSPILYGCRTGICSTCLVNVTAGLDNLSPATSDEQELLAIIAPDTSTARLACQFEVLGDIEIEYLGK
jgi:ferredoxin